MVESGISDYPQTAPGTGNHGSETENFLLLFNAFFGFSEQPFNNTPDPHFFFTSRRHCEALLSISFGVKQRRGFIVVTGEVGSGKTTLCRQFLHQLSPEIKTAVILNPKISGTHLLGSVIHDFGIECRGRTKRDYFEALNKFLIDGLGHEQNACLIIDEAQGLNVRLLEEIRLLSNLETSKQKLLQIVLLGQPELRDLLKKTSLRQLRQRIGVYAHLQGLDLEETQSYIHHRLTQAGSSPEQIWFAPQVVAKIHEVTRGIPRLVNTVCDRVLMAAYSQQTKEITSDVATCAFEELAFICA